jgi:hypothetical protein
MGEVYARSWSVIEVPGKGLTPKRAASYALLRLAVLADPALDHLDAVEVRADRILKRGHEERRRLAARRGGEVAPPSALCLSATRASGAEPPLMRIGEDRAERDEPRTPVQPNRSVVWEKGPAVAAAAPADRPPNIILIVADDLATTTSRSMAEVWRMARYLHRTSTRSRKRARICSKRMRAMPPARPRARRC